MRNEAQPSGLLSSLASLIDKVLIPFGRRSLLAFVPSLADLADEEVATQPEYRSHLRVAGLAPFYLLLAPLPLLVDPRSSVGLWGAVAAVVTAIFMLGASAFSLKAVMRVRSRAESEADTKRAADPNYRNVEHVRAERALLERNLFQRNLQLEFNLMRFEWTAVSVFEDGCYNFAPRINVLLGKNGFGKTLLFRTLVAVLQRDAEYSGLLFGKPNKSTSRPSKPRSVKTIESSGLLKAEVTRKGNAVNGNVADVQEIVRDATYFDDRNGQPVGKIPILAIPDSRFLNRTRRTVSGAASTDEPLANSGAKHYLTQEPFENVVQDLLTQLCIDYLEPVGSLSRKRGFDRRIFRLIEEVVAELTDDEGFGFAEINRIGQTGFEILVRTSGAQDLLPIQAASQGTLSVVAIFGLIYSFLESLRRNVNEDKVQAGAAIVLVDEIDAHLHPSWQQKIMGMLTRSFPNVQFIVSAHGPAIVAGCDEYEVSVLRKNSETGKFSVETLPDVFLGVPLEQIYERVFAIEDVDRLYLEYTAKSSQDNEEREAKIDRLLEKDQLSSEHQEELSGLLRERRLVEHAEQARQRRLQLIQDATQAEMLKCQITQLQAALAIKDEELIALNHTVTKLSGKADHGIS